jgi:DNA-binding phage protein
LHEITLSKAPKQRSPKLTKAIGIDRGSLYKSLKDGSNLEWNTIMKVLDYLGYEIRLVKQKRKGR